MAGNKTMHVHYTGKLDDGTVFDSSADREPLSFEVGSGQVIPGFEEQVKDLEVGESATFTLEPEQAYGPHDPRLIMEVPATQAPEGLSEGDRVRLQDGRAATVVEIGTERVTIDANHPLAGKALTFEVQLVGG
jgi:peptidylprolyl isomerase